MKLVHYGDPVLREKCKPVIDFESIRYLLQKFYDTMYEEEGLGLAANQVGYKLQFFAIDISHVDDDERPRIFINGKITRKIGECAFDEGCLSIPKLVLSVTRPERITFRYQDENENFIEEEFNGLMARAIQHEVDHLNGILIFDRISQAEKNKIKKDLKSIRSNTLSKINIRSKNRNITI